jgi:hypothetical protein
MSFFQEVAWNNSTIGGGNASQGLTGGFVGGGAELIVVMVDITTDAGCTGAHLGAHANLTVGTSYIGTVANGVLQVCCWGTWNGGATNPTITVVFDGGNAGANGGKLTWSIYTGYASNIIASPGPSAMGTATSTSPAVSVTGVAAGSLIVACGDSNNQNFTAGAGYTLQFNTSAWSSHITAIEQTTGLSEPGGTANVSWTLGSSVIWSMLAVAFPGTGALPLAIPSANQCILLP